MLSIFLVMGGCRSDRGKQDAQLTGPGSATGDADIVFKEYEHDFGKVTEGEKIAYLFSYENKGPGDLVINSASTSCGCTVSKYDTKPIAPGSHGTLEVVFNTSGRSGMQTKTVTVHSNSKTPSVILKITAEVVKKSK